MDIKKVYFHSSYLNEHDPCIPAHTLGSVMFRLKRTTQRNFIPLKSDNAGGP
jgi:hypothetical protein